MKNKSFSHYQASALFNRLKSKGIFWSYAETLTYTDIDEALLCEYTMKYGDFQDLKELFSLYEQHKIKEVWEERLVEDKSFVKLNLFLARIFFDMDIESGYFVRSESARFKKFKLLAS